MDSVKTNIDTVDGVQNNKETGTKTPLLSSGHGGHSRFLEKAIIKKYVKIGGLGGERKTYIGNNRESMVSTVSKDDRFNSKSFRNSVRIVFEELGLQPTFKNFEKYDSIIDWHALSRSLQYPVFRAKCYVLCNNTRMQPKGTMIETPDGHLTTLIDLPAPSRDEAIKKLNTKTHKFIEWW